MIDLTVQNLALTCFALLAFGGGAMLLLTQVPKHATVAKDALPILGTEILIVGMVVGAIWIGGWVLTLAILALVIRVGFEVADVASHRITLPYPLAIGAGIAGIAWVASFAPIWILALFSLGAMAITAVNLKWAEDERLRIILDLTLFPGIPLVLFAAAAISGGHGVLLLLAFLLVETFDSYALLGGKLFGKTKAFPILSPKKTIEGLGAGLVMLVLTVLIGALLFDTSLGIAISLAVLTVPLAIAGDLCASRVKRKSGVKDYPTVLRQQGGLFDITDAWITTSAGFLVLAALSGAG